MNIGKSDRERPPTGGFSFARSKERRIKKFTILAEQTQLAFWAAAIWLEEPCGERFFFFPWEKRVTLAETSNRWLCGGTS
ncbi:MAG TPA: hypothetical protein VFC44_06790 [Candidatus Saccharimonadales bacterium]|nr:hypothetical protein [Candidatus Saccharimonadales bacterium]